jgi:hypothetical protein
MFAKELGFNHLILYSGALHLCALRQSFSYKYYGAPHLLELIQGSKVVEYLKKCIWKISPFKSLEKGQSRIIFVEMHLKNVIIGAEHRNINPIHKYH